MIVQSATLVFKIQSTCIEPSIMHPVGFHPLPYPFVINRTVMSTCRSNVVGFDSIET